MKTLKKNIEEKGITLVALVVTIIILLILAGVTINMVLGQDGLIKKSKIAKEKYENSALEEQEEMNGATEIMNNLYSQYSTPSEDNVVKPVVKKGDVVIIKSNINMVTIGDTLKVSKDALMDQEFYVIGKENNNLTLLSKYNLNKNPIEGSTTIFTQAPNKIDAETSVAFSSSYYWYVEGKLVSWQLDLNKKGTDEVLLDDTDIAIKRAADYGNYLTGNSGRLLTEVETKENLKTTLGANYEKIIWGQENGSKQNYLMYWIATVADNNKMLIRTGFGMSKAWGASGPNDATQMGVRPVINIQF